MPSNEQSPSESWVTSGGLSARALAGLTPRAQRVLTGADQAARRLQHPELGSEHLLLAMMGDESANGTLLLRQMGGDPRRVIEALERAYPPGTATTTQSLPLGTSAQRVLRSELERFARTGSLVGTRELLSSVIAEGALLPVLSDAGLEFDRRGRPRKSASGATERGAAEGTRDTVISFRASDDDAAAVEALVEVGIMRTRSEAAAWLLHSGVNANRALFERVAGLKRDIASLREEARKIADEHAAPPAV